MNYNFQKRPVVIQAFKMTPDRRIDQCEWPEWLAKAYNLERNVPGAVFPTNPSLDQGTLSIHTLEGDHLVAWGDWIIQGVHGELYPCKPEIFAATYDPVD